MKGLLKRIISAVTVVVMLITTIPLSGFVGIELPSLAEIFNVKAEAANGRATYTANIYFMDTNGAYPSKPSESEILEGNVGEEVTAEEIVYTGFTLVHTSSTDSTVLSDGSTVISLYYARNCYTISFVIDGISNSYMCFYGEKIPSIEPPYKEGYIFMGWSPAIPNTMPNCDITVYANFAQGCKVEFYDFYGELFFETNVEYGSKVSAPERDPDGAKILKWLDAYGNEVTFPKQIKSDDTVCFYVCMTEEACPYTTLYGTLEETSYTAVFNNPENSYYTITVDGKDYNLLPGMDNPEEHIGKTIAFSYLNDEAEQVVWLKPIDKIKTGISCFLEAENITIKDGEQEEDSVTVSLRISNTCSDFKGDFSALKDLSIFDTTVVDITLESPDTDIYNFGKKILGTPKNEYTYEINKKIEAGQSINISFDAPIEFVSELKKSDKNYTARVNYKVTALKGMETITESGTDRPINFINGNYVKEVSKPSQQINRTSQAKAAATQLVSLQNSAITLDADTSGTLDKLLTAEQKRSIKQALLTLVATAEMPQESLENYLSKKLIEKIFKIDTGLLSLGSKEISCTFIVNSAAYGEIKIVFTCKWQDYFLSGQKFAFLGNINYEITGGRGYNKLPSEIKKEGMAGALTGANIEAFCNSVAAVAESELKSAYNMAWGDDFNAAVDIIFGKTVNKILSHTKFGSASGLTWTLLTTPSKKIQIKCPVDVYVYNAENELVASVESNEVVMLNDENVDISINGDMKTVTLYNDSYRLEYRSTAESEMEISVTEYASSESLLRTTSIENIPLEIGTNYTQSVDNDYLNDSDYSLTAEDETVIAPTSDKTELHWHESNGEWFTEKEPDCFSNGSKYTLCTVCDMSYEEILPAFGHSDSNSDNSCDNCNKTMRDIALSIINPVNRTVKYGEATVLYASASNLPSGYKIKWTTDSRCVSLKPSFNGNSCAVTAESTGDVVIKAYIVDKTGNTVANTNGELISDNVYLYSEANLWLKIVYFFRKIFGLSTALSQAIRYIF